MKIKLLEGAPMRKFISGMLLVCLSFTGGSVQAALKEKNLSTQKLITKTATCTDCMNYKLLGTCIWLKCRAFPPSCAVLNSILVEHYLPDFVVAAYSNKNPWDDFDFLTKKKMGAITTDEKNSSASDANFLDTNLDYKHVDIFVHPAILAYNQAAANLGFSCRSTERIPLQPKFLSDKDPSWRSPLVEQFYPQALIGQPRMSATPSLGLDKLKKLTDGESGISMDSIKDGIKDTVKEKVDEVKQEITDVKDNITDLKDGLKDLTDVDKLKEKAKGELTNAKDNIKQGIDDAKDTVSDGINDVKEGASDLKDKIAGVFDKDKKQDEGGDQDASDDGDEDSVVSEGGSSSGSGGEDDTNVASSSKNSSSTSSEDEKAEGFSFEYWGPIYPRSGWTSLPFDSLSAVVTAQRASDIVTGGPSAHVFIPAGRDCGKKCWAPPKVTVGDEANRFQMMYPKPEKDAQPLPRTGKWSRGMETGDEKYAWVLWRKYQCCRDRGKYIGKIKL